MNLNKFYKGKKVLITGYTGFKGAWLTEILSLWDARVVGIALPPHTSPNLYTVLGLSKKTKNYFSDIREYEKIESIFKKEKPEIVIHLAAQAIVKTSYEKPLLTYSSNVMGSANILQAIRNTDSVRSAVMITSDKAYDNVEWVYPYRETDPLGGQDPYSASKGAADIIDQSFIKSFLSEKNSPYVAVARAGNVIGGGDWALYRIVPDIIRAVYEQNEPVLLRAPKSIRPWQHVLEPLSGYLLLAYKLYKGDRSLVSTWNFGPKDENFISVEGLTKKGIKLMGRGLYKAEKTRKFHEANLLKLDISKARTFLGWNPRLNVNDTLAFTFLWYKNYYEKIQPPSDFTDNQIKMYFSKKYDIQTSRN